MGRMGSGIFFARGLDEWNRIERLRNFSFSAQPVLTAIKRTERCVDRALRLTGKSLRDGDGSH